MKKMHLISEIYELDYALKVGDKTPLTNITITQQDLDTYEFAVSCIPELKDYLILDYDGVPDFHNGEGFKPFSCEINYTANYCPLIKGFTYLFCGETVKLKDFYLNKFHSYWICEIEFENNFILTVKADDLILPF